MSDRSTIANPAMELDPVLNKLYQLFGFSTAFIPLSLGRQEPANNKWRDITLETSRSSAHLNLLWNSDIAVVCGPVSFNLCALRFNNDAALARFQELNPGMTTLTTKHPDGVWLWVRIEGFAPKTQRLPDCMWQSDGFVRMFDRRPHGEKHVVLEAIEPQVTSFASICWSKETTTWLLPEIVASDYGNPFEPAENEMSRPNYAFWSKCFALAHGICFALTQKSFYHREPGGNEWTYMAEERVQDLFVRWVMQLKKSKGHEFITVLAEPHGLKRILESLRVVAAGELPPEQDVMVQFLDECVTASAGGSATTEELYLAFKNLCTSRRLAPMPPVIFKCVIGPLLRQRFGVCNSHSLVRNGVCRRGFNYIRVAYLPSGTNGTHGTGGGESVRQVSSA